MLLLSSKYRRHYRSTSIGELYDMQQGWAQGSILTLLLQCAALALHAPHWEEVSSLTPCQLRNQLCKWDPRCPESHGDVELRPFLVTGAGSSGTAWVRASLAAKGLDVADESWGQQLRGVSVLPASGNGGGNGGGKGMGKPIAEQGFERSLLGSRSFNASAGKDGSVAWTARCWVSPRQRRWLAAADEGHGLALFLTAPRVRFRAVLHVVRHPLRQIRSNAFFSDNLQQCWPLSKQSTHLDGGGGGGGGGGRGHRSPGNATEYCEWNWWRLQIWEYAAVFAPPPPRLLSTSAADGGQGRERRFFAGGPGAAWPGGTLLWSGDGALRPALAISALHWLAWDGLAASAADATVRLEDGGAVCGGGGDDDSCSSGGGGGGRSADGGSVPSNVAGFPGESRGSAPTTLCRWLLARARAEGWAGGLDRPGGLDQPRVDCERPDAPREGPAKNSHGGFARKALTWASLEAVTEVAVVQAIRARATTYGYDADGF